MEELPGRNKSKPKAEKDEQYSCIYQEQLSIDTEEIQRKNEIKAMKTLHKIKVVFLVLFFTYSVNNLPNYSKFIVILKW